MLLRIENDRRLVPADRESTQLINRHETGDVIEVDIVKEKQIGSMNMHSLFMIWMRETSAWMAAHGGQLEVTKDGKGTGVFVPFDENTCRRYFTSFWVGTPSEGSHYSWARSKDAAEKEGGVMMDKGQRFHCMEKHEAWAVDRGIKLTVPVKSEYRELMERMSEN